VRLAVILAWLTAATAARADVPRTLYLNRCVADCPVAVGADDARADTSSVVSAGTLTRLPRLDLAWADVVLCAGELLAPYDVQIVTDTEPAAGTSYLEVMIAGLPEEVGLPGGTLGAAPGGCEPLDHGLAFVFGNLYDLLAEPERARDLCETLAHQVGRLWGLDRTDECRDPMLDGSVCAGRRWFVDVDRACDGCACGETVNSHARLLEVLGPGEGQPPPHVEIVDTDGRSVSAEVTRGRPLDRVELVANGEVVDVVAADASGTYTLRAPAGGPVQVRAYDDLDRVGGADAHVTDGSCAAGGGGGSWLVVVLIALRSAGSRGPARRRGTARA